MKLAAMTHDGGAAVGIVSGNEVLDRDGLLHSVLADVHVDDAALARHKRPLRDVRLRAPLPHCEKLICVASNYMAHIKEAGQEAPQDRRTVTPWLLLKPATTIVGDGAPIPVPSEGQAIDWEVEVATVIGRRGKHIPAGEALHYVAGYTIVNDISERRIKVPDERQPREWDKFFDWLHGKWFDGFAPMGPWVVTADEIPDPQDLGLELRVNDRLRQQGNTRDMIYSVAELVAFASSIMTLTPGDVIATGTPHGVGSATGQFLQPGDVIECKVERLGTLSNPVRVEHEA